MQLMPRTMTVMTIALASGAMVPVHAQDAPAPVRKMIDSSRITESTPATRPQTLVQPLPAEHRIAPVAGASALDPERYRAAREALDRGLAWLASKQAANGSWTPDTRAAPTDEPQEPTSVSMAISAMVVKAFAQSGTQQDALERGVINLVESTGSERGFAFEDDGRLGTYVAAAVCSALAAVDHPVVLDRKAEAIRWLKAEQWGDEDGLKPRQDWYGGAGYGNRQRPDLSNTQLMLDALHDAGVSPEDPAVQRALVFVSRTQNLTDMNDASWALQGDDDGGFIYTPANGGESMASEYVGEGRYGELLPEGMARSLRSYGSMTYAGFKSLLYAGLSREDPRVQAALNWIRNNWTFEENPGLGQQGLYYYLHAAARALNANQMDTITTPDGIVHDWRAELIDALLASQSESGSWQNDAPRWLEGEPVLATAYALLALEEALKPPVRP